MFGPVRLIDLSVPLEPDAVSEPAPAQVRCARHDGEGLRQMRQLLGVKPEDLVYSNGLGWAVEEVQALTHTGTHVDAPYHYGPTSEGRPARTIDQVPLEWCFAPGVVLDVRHKAAGEFITVADLEAALTRIGYTLRPLDIVLLHTGADRRLGSADYFAQPGLGREGVLWLVGQGVKVIGIDAYTLDRPFASMVADYRRTGDGRYVWPAHFAGITREYCQIEKLDGRDRAGGRKPWPGGTSGGGPAAEGPGLAPGLAPERESGAPEAPADPGLAAVVEAWPSLPEPIRRAVLALVESTRGG